LPKCDDHSLLRENKQEKKTPTKNGRRGPKVASRKSVVHRPVLYILLSNKLRMFHLFIFNSPLTSPSFFSLYFAVIRQPGFLMMVVIFAFESRRSSPLEVGRETGCYRVLTIYCLLVFYFCGIFARGYLGCPLLRLVLFCVCVSVSFLIKCDRPVS
jgi:hypothetical protein